MNVACLEWAHEELTSTRVEWPLRDNTAISIARPRGSLHLGTHWTKYPPPPPPQQTPSTTPSQSSSQPFHQLVFIPISPTLFSYFLFHPLFLYHPITSTSSLPNRGEPTRKFHNRRYLYCVLGLEVGHFWNVYKFGFIYLTVRKKL